MYIADNQNVNVNEDDHKREEARGTQRHDVVASLMSWLNNQSHDRWFIISSISCEHCRVALTVDNPGYPPESEQDQKTYPIKGVLMEDEDNVQDERHYHHKTIKHLKFVQEEFQAVCKHLPSQLQHEEGENSQAQVVKNLKNT